MFYAIGKHKRLVLISLLRATNFMLCRIKEKTVNGNQTNYRDSGSGKECPL